MGPQYAESGTDLIRLMALTLPTVSFVTVYTALARVRRRLRLAVVVQCIFGVVVLCGIVFAADRWGGIIGVGYVYLAADIAVVLLLLVPGVRLIRLALDPATTSRVFSGTPVPTAASNPPTAASEPDRRMTTR